MIEANVEANSWTVRLEFRDLRRGSEGHQAVIRLHAASEAVSDRRRGAFKPKPYPSFHVSTFALRSNHHSAAHDETRLERVYMNREIGLALVLALSTYVTGDEDKQESEERAHGHSEFPRTRKFHICRL